MPPKGETDVAMSQVEKKSKDASRREAKNLRKLAHNYNKTDSLSSYVKIAVDEKTTKQAKQAANSLRKKGAAMSEQQKHNVALLAHLEKMNLLLENIATPAQPAPEATLHAKLWTDFGKLVTAGLSFVAGLAWKDFFKEAFDLEPISAHILVNQFVYALLVSFISCLAIYVILKFVDRMGKIDYEQKVKAFDESLKISAGFMYLDEILGVTREWNELREGVDDVMDRLGLDTDSEAEEEAGAAPRIDDFDDDDDERTEHSVQNHRTAAHDEHDQ